MATGNRLSIVEERGLRAGKEHAERKGPQRESVACYDEGGGLGWAGFGVEWEEPSGVALQARGGRTKSELGHSLEGGIT